MTTPFTSLLNSLLGPANLAGRINRNSYYDRSGGNWRQSESLLRARRPYLFKNIALGAGLLVFAGSICASFPPSKHQ